LEQLVLDGSHQSRTYEVELEGEIRGIHLDCLAIRFIVNVLASATKGSGIARFEEEVQILGCCSGKIDESRKTISFTDVPAQD
jgi:hypothetical protein